MTKYNFHRLLTAAQDCATIDEYIAEEGGSLPAEYYFPEGSAEDAVELLGAIYNLSKNFCFREIRKISGLSQHDFAEWYNIPQRSIENWDSGVRNAPSYVLELLAADVLSSKATAKSEG